MRSEFYSRFGCYGRPCFMELAKRLGIVEKRAGRILDEFSHQKDQIKTFVERSILSQGVKAKFLTQFADKLQRLEANKDRFRIV